MQKILAKCKEGIRNKYKTMVDIDPVLLDEEKFAIQVFKNNLLNESLVFRLIGVEVNTLQEIIEKSIVYEGENKLFGNRLLNKNKDNVEVFTCGFCNKKGHVMQNCFHFMTIQSNSFNREERQNFNHPPYNSNFNQFSNDARFINNKNQYSNNSRFNNNFFNQHRNNSRFNNYNHNHKTIIYWWIQELRFQLLSQAV